MPFAACPNQRALTGFFRTQVFNVMSDEIKNGEFALLELIITNNENESPSRVLRRWSGPMGKWHGKGHPSHAPKSEYVPADAKKLFAIKIERQLSNADLGTLAGFYSGNVFYRLFAGKRSLLRKSCLRNLEKELGLKQGELELAEPQLLTNPLRETKKVSAADKIREIYLRDGLSITELISAEAGCGRAYVYKVLKRMGVQISGRHTKSRVSLKKAWEINKGASPAQLARLAGCSVSAAYSFLKEQGYHFKPIKERVKECVSEQGITDHHLIAKLVGCDRKYAWQILDEMKKNNSIKRP